MSTPNEPGTAQVVAPKAVLGVSMAALRAFTAEYAGKTFKASHEERAGDGADLRSLPFAEMRTEQVVAHVIKPATAHARCSYADMLLKKARTRRLRASGAAGCLHPSEADAGVPDSARATRRATRTWELPRFSCRTRGLISSRTWWRR